MKEIDYNKIVKVEIEHDYFNWSSKCVVDIKDYIDTLNYYVKNNVKIKAIRFYEREEQ